MIEAPIFGLSELPEFLSTYRDPCLTASHDRISMNGTVSRLGFCNIGAFIIRIGFGSQYTRSPRNGIGNSPKP